MPRNLYMCIVLLSIPSSFFIFPLFSLYSHIFIIYPMHFRSNRRMRSISVIHFAANCPAWPGCKRLRFFILIVLTVCTTGRLLLLPIYSSAENASHVKLCSMCYRGPAMHFVCPSVCVRTFHSHVFVFCSLFALGRCICICYSRIRMSIVR